jgi:tetratricopeptide (TPR) repeat protein
MKRLPGLILAVVALTWPVLGFAEGKDDPAQIMAAARAAYDRGDFPAAIEAYQSLIKDGHDSAGLYYNLGNAEFKAVHIGRAIADYRRALRRDPGDDDIRFNLNYAKSLVRQPPDRSGPLTKWVENAFLHFSGQQVALAAWAVYFILMILAGILIWKRGRGSFWRWSVSVAGLAFLLMAGWASLRIMLEKDMGWGVVVTAQAEARNGPGEDNHVGFTVPEGREVRILGREGNWVAIGLAAEGYKGWVKAEEIWEDE